MKHYEAGGFKVGDWVKVVNYGSMSWVNRGGGVIEEYDSFPERIGTIDFIQEISETQGRIQVSLSRSAWYNIDQLEKTEQPK